MWSYLEKGSLQMQWMKMRFSGSEQAWNSMTDVLIRRPCERTEIQSGYIHRGRQTYEDRGRDWSCAAQHKEHQGLRATTRRQDRHTACLSPQSMALLSPWLLTSSLHNYGRINDHLAYLICYPALGNKYKYQVRVRIWSNRIFHTWLVGM